MEEQAAYLQQLKNETELDLEDPKQRLLSELVDTVSLLCHQVYSVGAVTDGLSQTMDEVVEAIETLADFSEAPEDDEVMGVDEYFEGTESPLYEVKCPQCGDRFAVDEQTLQKGFSCPSCGEMLIRAE